MLNKYANWEKQDILIKFPIRIILERLSKQDFTFDETLFVYECTNWKGDPEKIELKFLDCLELIDYCMR